MKTILFIIFLFGSLYLCAAPLQEKKQTIFSVDSVYQEQMAAVDVKMKAMELKLDSIGAVNRDLLFSRELYSNLISTQLYWFGFFLAVVTLLFGWINFKSVFSRLKEYKKEQEEYKQSVTGIVEAKSIALENKFDNLITVQKAEFKEETKKLNKDIIRVKIDACRVIFLAVDDKKIHDTSLCWALSVLIEMIKLEDVKETSIDVWIKISEKTIRSIKASFSVDNYKVTNERLKEILDSIDEKHKERIKLLQENVNIKYYSLLEKSKEAKTEKPKN